MSAAPPEGRVFIVTGAGGAIGGEVARRLGQDGARLSLCDLHSPDALVEELGGPARVLSQAADVRSRDQIQTLVAKTMERFGRLDGLVTVAGVVSQGAFETITEDEWDRVHSINLKGVFLTCQAVIAPLRDNGFGRIVNLGSVVGKNGGNPRPWIDPAEQATASNAAYGSSKAGVHALTLYLAKELARFNITVNAVAPGPVASQMTAVRPERLSAQIPLQRLGRPEEAASAVAYLCSDEASFITGEILDVNGGLWCD